MLNGYIKVNRPISAAEAQIIKQTWTAARETGEVVVLGQGVEFVPLDRPVLDPSIVMCGHCGQWAAVQTECKHCGASVR